MVQTKEPRTKGKLIMENLIFIAEYFQRFCVLDEHIISIFWANFWLVSRLGVGYVLKPQFSILKPQNFSRDFPRFWSTFVMFWTWSGFQTSQVSKPWSSIILELICPCCCPQFVLISFTFHPLAWLLPLLSIFHFQNYQRMQFQQKV